MTDVVNNDFARVNPTPDASPVETPESGALSSDFDTFLTLLTAQLENQDPTEPMDSTEWVAQLATFSSVEQQTLTNEWMAVISDQLAVTSMAELGVWIGMEAQVVAPGYWNGEDPITIMPNPPTVSDKVQLVVFDENELEVYRRDIEVSADPIEWTGIDTFGNTVEPGRYTIEIESYAGEELLAIDRAEIFAPVTEVRSIEGQATLVLEGGYAINAADVLAVREPPADAPNSEPEEDEEL